jgi:hypothetical protein
LFLIDLADHPVDVGQDLLVHLRHPCLSAGLGAVDEGEGPAAVLAKFGQALHSGQEDRAGQAGVGVRATVLHRQDAVAARQGLRGQAVAGLRPCAWASGPSGSMLTRSPLTLTLVACSQRRRTVWSVMRA